MTPQILLVMTLAPQIMYLNLTILYNELVYYLHTHLLLSDTINS